MAFDWDKLRVFHAVAEAGSFTHAGESLNLSQSAVSRQIQALEEALRVPLFHRHARGLILTEQGETLNRTVREVFAKLALAETMLTESRERPAGRLKVTTTIGFGSTWLAPRLARFLALHPEVSVTMLLDDSDLDLAMREADVAIRMHPPRQPDLIQRHLASFGWRVRGSAGYLKGAGVPQRAEDLDAHRLIVWGDYRQSTEQVNWLAEAGRRPGSARRAVVEVNSLPAMAQAVRSGLGLAALPDYMAAEIADLVAVLPDLKPPRLEAYFVYPEEMRHSKRVAVFRDFLVAELAAEAAGQVPPAPGTVQGVAQGLASAAR